MFPLALLKPFVLTLKLEDQNTNSKCVNNFKKIHTSQLWWIYRIRSLITVTLNTHLDVASLYTNIPQQEGIDACLSALSTRLDNMPPTDDLTKLILECNNFKFNDTNYSPTKRHHHGTIMVTRMSHVEEVIKETLEIDHTNTLKYTLSILLMPCVQHVYMCILPKTI